MVSSNSFRDLVNQKLHFARLQLAFVVSQCSNETLSGKKNQDLVCALREGVVLHLNNAYSLYLKEIAENYQCPTEEVSNITGLRTTLAKLNKFPGEIQELENLERDAESWLARISKVGQMSNLLPAESPRANLSTTSITLKAVDQPGLNTDQIDRWMASFVELLDRQRGLMVEC